MRHVLRVALAIPLLALVTCLEPTEVRITFYTDICELHALDVFVSGQPSPVAHVDLPMRDCPPPDQAVFSEQRIGDLVFTPRKPNERRFSVEARGERRGGMCPTTGCVLASRNIAYLDHTPLALDITLDHDCIDVPCPTGTTCVHGSCQDNHVDCPNKTCTDGGTSPDARVDAIAVLDALEEATLFDGSSCKVPPLVNALGKPSLYWNMDGPSSTTIVEQVGMMVKTMVAQGDAISTSNPAMGCGRYLTIDVPQPLMPGHNSDGIGFTAWVYVSPNMAASQILSKATGAGSQGVILLINSKYQIVVTTQNSNVAFGSWTGQTVLATNMWHAIELDLPSTALSPVVFADGIPVGGTGTVSASWWGPGTLTLGGAPGDAIDELRVFDLN